MESNIGRILPHVIISSVCLKYACTGILAECLDENENLIMHHNLAPFQYRIICDYSGMYVNIHIYTHTHTHAQYKL